ncbi:glyoxylate reductase/hydroxypyruvate reductase-like [Eupeodes corollae]|uniref:glyoxylate reductase/hydroxypyruvate reductase-like n=1 Tax=Eupeodes corollae TaxID=290404 RepID=UPI0024936A0E|nr:glyoxylate reductase/hydroxypyruvate reductase-like [Eupeodes corollae]
MTSRLFKVLVTHPEVPKQVLDTLKQKCEVIVCKNVPPLKSEVLEKIQGADAILWAHYQPLNGEILDAAGSQLKAVSTMSSGIDYVDIAEFKKRQMPLGHTPRAVNNSVADIAIGLMISAGRLFHEGRRMIETSQWETDRHDWLMGQEISDSTVGFFGFGGIGQVIARRLLSFDVKKIIYNTRTKKPNEADFNASHVAFDQLLSDSDFIIVASPLTPETKGIFNAEAFAKMKPNCVFVNVARGQIVDQHALYNALKKRQIFAAGLDVTTPEPLPSDDPLLSVPNCIILPHVGTSTAQTTIKMGNIAVQNILNALEGKPMVAPAY